MCVRFAILLATLVWASCPLLFITTGVTGLKPQGPSEGNKSLSSPTGIADISLSYSIPTIEEHLRSMSVVVNMSSFRACSPKLCSQMCFLTDPKEAYCDNFNPKLCMCDPYNFHPSALPGTILPIDWDNSYQRNCSIACNKRSSHGRIWIRTDKDNSTYCLCVMKQTTKSGITLCDSVAKVDVCAAICQTDVGTCSFNGACLCRSNWEPFFNLSVANVRKELPEDNHECQRICEGYHHDYVSRIWDSKNKLPSAEKVYSFREKYCICGPYLDLRVNAEAKAIINQGFQLCTGLKCKRRCGMDEAMCEPNFRRACLCQRESILIGDHLWSRLPMPTEARCFETCLNNDLDARVIEWNPLIVPEDLIYEPHYRKTSFQFNYDGKFCHCIKTQIDMHQYRPCTDELCRLICGHYEAECDKRTRRACFCKTHQLAHNMGRNPDPGELNCDIACRFGLYDAKILDLTWEGNVKVEAWGVRNSKYCACIQGTTPAGLSHCDPVFDDCPRYCGVSMAYCTREKYCHCGVLSNNALGLTAKNQLVRVGNDREADECGEKCISWLWPLSEDNDNKPYIYDESLGSCVNDGVDVTCTRTNSSSSTNGNSASSSRLFVKEVDSLEEDTRRRKFCLCAKSMRTTYRPGNRIIAHIEPERLSPDIPCPGNHTCAIVGSGLHVVT